MSIRWNKKIWSSVRKEVRKQIVKETEAVSTEATRLVLETSKTGNLYHRNTITHQASAPGEPFASDTGNALNLIQTRYEDDYFTGIVNAGAEYAAALEFGTEKMEPRPTMRPALENRRKNINVNIGNAVKRGIRKGS
ncbi:MAG: hypothetical protein JKY50_22335 [Oleispira sp.]|nr:hypothetical protein [Oleispira sp.]